VLSMTLQLVIRYLVLLSIFYWYLMNVQNFQPGGFQFYDAMSFIIPSTAHGHSSFRGTRSNDAVQVPADALDDDEDIPGAFLLLWH
jgi:hypothetical protein